MIADATDARPVDGPLAGTCVLVTRAPHQAAALAEPLAALGAEVLIAPAIDTIDPEDWGPVDAAIAGLDSYDWVILTSANAVDRFLGRMAERGIARSALTGIRIAVVGSATAERLQEHGVTPDLMPADFRGEGLIEAFRAVGAGAGVRFLLPRAASAREILPETLRADGAEVDVVAVYRTVPAQPEPAVIERLRSAEVDVVTFTSPSTVRHFVAWLESAGLDASAVLGRAAAASIGPVTTEALRERGYDVPIEAAGSTMRSLVDAISAVVTKRSGIR
ncbi:MAG: uroporphyrinogen-III synthase [Coriobacteriia bacterium]|nr:uroporphyrinogen-III synthase [Coriobacteriia bacterium]